MRLASDTRRKVNGEWTGKPNYFDIVVWDARAESAARYLAKGRPITVDGRLEWNEWTGQDGVRRQGVAVVAETVRFLGVSDDQPVTSVAAAADEPTAEDATPVAVAA